MDKSLKYKRGTVWWYHDTCDKKNVDTDDHVQHGDRPMLIVSSDAGNLSNPTCICLSLSTKVSKSKGINTTVKNDVGVDNIILCNQFKTVNKSQLTKYLYTLSDYDMKKVEEAMITSLQLDYLLDALLCTYSIDKLNSVIEGIIVSKVKELKSSESGKILSSSQIYEKIDSLVKSLETESTEIKSSSKSESDKHTLSVSPECIVTFQNNRRIWTEDLMKQYLEDADTMDGESMKAKYALKSTGDISKYRTYCKKRLKVT